MPGLPGRILKENKAEQTTLKLKILDNGLQINTKLKLSKYNINIRNMLRLTDYVDKNEESIFRSYFVLDQKYYVSILPIASYW